MWGRGGGSGVAARGEGFKGGTCVCLEDEDVSIGQSERIHQLWAAGMHSQVCDYC